MSSRDPDLAALAGELARALRDLQRELEPRDRPLRPPTPREILRFTDRVAIPAVILVLETNVRALRLLQRAIRVSEREADVESETRRRAEAVSRATLDRLDDALAELQAVVEGRPSDDAARALLEDARELRAEVDERLAASARPGGADPDSGNGDGAGSDGEGVAVDVDAELASIKDDLDRAGDGNGDDG